MPPLEVSTCISYKKTMTATEKQTTEAIYNMYLALPDEVKMEVKRLIDDAVSVRPEPFTVDSLIKGNWNDEGKTYSRDELYDDNGR